jgi:hypothetical protein
MGRGSRRGRLSGSAAAIAPPAGIKISPPGSMLQPEVLMGAKPSEPTGPGAPEFYASGCQIAVVLNDFILTLTRPRAILVDVGGEQTPAGTMVPVAHITMAPTAMKDMWTVMGGLLDQYEAEMGPIDTPFLRSLAASKK